MPGFLAVLLATLALAGPSFCVELPTAVLVVEQGDAAGLSLARQLQGALKDKVDLERQIYSAQELGNPIYKGKLLAGLSAARLVVSVGDAATGLALEELEDTPIYFVGASLAPGETLAEPQVAGLLGYSPKDVLSAAPKSWRGGLGLLYSPGYEPVVAEIRAKAREAGVTLLERRIRRLKELPPAARSLMGTAKAVWVLGDPMLERGAGFDFLVEESLDRNVPLVGAGPWEVGHGAVFCSQGKGAAVAEAASRNIASLLESGKASPRLGLAPEGGRILFHKSLAERYGLSPKEPVWMELK